ncbi:MAG: methylmalonyl-CoA mutase family protein [Deltaproteobacteria bacterium]|nr:methylmalonyl-CoA mutase family protein [Deltaproteobacteria bacterium]
MKIMATDTSTFNKTLSECPERAPRFSTVSDLEIDRLYTSTDLIGWDPQEALGNPGEFPYTRGVHQTLYRDKLWTMRQFSGFGTPEQTNKRLHDLLRKGQTGLSIAFHMPTLMGYDSDHPRSQGEIGKCGVAIDSLRDMEVLLDKIPLDQVTTSMTTNAPAAILLSMYIAVAEKQGVPQEKLRGTIQNDILKEYIAQKTYIFPPKPSMRIIQDILVYCTQRLPLWNTISVSGYHIREAGSTAAQELGFTLADGIAYVQAGMEAGLGVDEFAPRLSFFFNAHNDFFEEIAKYRAARRMWAHIMRDRFKAKDPRSWKCRFHTQTAGCSLTAQQPMNNVVRTTIQALAAVLGGTQSLHTNSLDETLALPSEEAVTLALRTQQIIAHESGVASVVDPLGGSYFVERLTNQLEEEATAIIEKINELGGMLRALEIGYPQEQIAKSSYHYQQQLEQKEKVIVGVNKYVVEENVRPSLLQIGEAEEQRQMEALQKVRVERHRDRVEEALSRLSEAAQGTKNVMPPILEAVRAYATLGEICDTLRNVMGTYQERVAV